jgi:hypothetical protein
MGGSYQRLCQSCISAIPRPGAAASPGAERKRKRRALLPKVTDAYTLLAGVADEEAAWLRREERRRR